MKSFYSGLLASILFISPGFQSFGQGKKPFRQLDLEPEIHFCPVSYEYTPHYVPGRVVTREKKRNTEFVVNYAGGITTEARQAFENGVLVILNDLFDSPVPVHINLDWKTLEEGTLAGASPTAYFSRIPNAPNPDEVYPVALAEKIARFPLNSPDEPDITITVNSKAEWYYDFENPGDIGRRFDFVTILLHEVLHGMGFTAVVLVTFDGVGVIGRFNNGRYSIYTDFLFNGAGKKITDIQDTTMAMGSELTSNDLFFNLISSEEQAKIFAPSKFDQGSSISHLDEATYNNTESALMTPTITPGAVELHPGIALEMLYDMGWDMTYLIHTPQPGKEDFTEDQLLEVEVISDSEFDESSLTIHYSTDAFTGEDVSEPLVFNTATGLYEAILPAPGEESTYHYYFSVVNSRQVTFTNPGEAPANSFEYRYQIDREAPVIQNTSPDEITDVDPQFVVEAQITDVYLGVETAAINWLINGAPQEPAQMERQEGFSADDVTDTYKGTLVFPGGPLTEGDLVEYQIVATDKSQAANTAATGFWTLEVVPVREGVVSYVNDFNVQTSDFTGMGFDIREVQGFADMAVHSPHPYPEAGQGNFRNLTYELTIPIVIRQEDPLIRFDEIVLVEIGEPGTAFGDEEFWDYVIVEGKRVGESEWLPFLPGYDSGANAAWQTAYNNEEEGSPSLYYPRIIDMTANGNFSPGDEVFIRFRLFSDPFANAWGWAIDNLRIQEQSTAVEYFVLEENFAVIPNPANGSEVLVSLDLENPSEGAEINLYDIYGRRMASYPIESRSKRIRQRIPLADVAPGVFIVNVAFNDRDMISKKIVRY